MVNHYKIHKHFCSLVKDLHDEEILCIQTLFYIFRMFVQMPNKTMRKLECFVCICYVKSLSDFLSLFIY